MGLTIKLLKFFTSKFFFKKYILGSSKFHGGIFFIAIFAYCYFFAYFFGDYRIFCSKNGESLKCESLNDIHGFEYYLVSFLTSIISIVLLIWTLWIIFLSIILIIDGISTYLAMLKRKPIKTLVSSILTIFALIFYHLITFPLVNSILLDEATGPLYWILIIIGHLVLWSILFFICIFILLIYAACMKCREDSLATIDEIKNDLKV